MERPRPVTVGGGLFAGAAAVLLLLGLLSLTAPRDGLRRTLAGGGVEGPAADTVLALVTVHGVSSVLGGVVLAVLTTGVRRGDPRARRAVVATAGVLVAMQLGFFVLGVDLFGPLGAVLVPVLLLAASALVLRPSAQPWFVLR